MRKLSISGVCHLVGVLIIMLYAYIRHYASDHAQVTVHHKILQSQVSMVIQVTTHLVPILWVLWHHIDGFYRLVNFLHISKSWDWGLIKGTQIHAALIFKVTLDIKYICRVCRYIFGFLLTGLRGSHIMQYRCGYCKSQYSWGYCESTATATACAVTSQLFVTVASEYPHSTLNGTVSWVATAVLRKMRPM